MSQTQQDQSPSQQGRDQDPDPLASLHKMSTTAGLGSTDYVAVNPTSIFALILGIASALTLFDEPILLLFPAAGVIASIFALRQIAKSSGTQTGRAIVALALVLSVGFGAIVLANSMRRNMQARHDKAALDSLIKDFSEHVKTGNFPAAYQLFTDRFRERVNPQTFADTMKAVQGNSLYGKLQAVTWKGLADFERDESTDTRVGVAQIIFVYEKVDELREQANFRYVDGKWTLDNIPSFFPAQKPPM